MEKAAPKQLQDNYNRYLPFIVEIRTRLAFLLSIFVIASILGFIYYEKIIVFTLGLFNLAGINIVFTSPFQYVNLAISSGLLIGLVAVFPLIIFQVLSFLKPALSPKEHRTLVVLIPGGILLFAIGFSFGIFIMRYVLVLFYQKSVELEIGNLLDISRFLSQILLTSALMGLAFQFPIVLTALMRLKVLKYEDIAKQRPLAYALSLIFAAFLPPTDLLSLALLTIPLVFLFETMLLLNRFVLKSHLL